MSDTTITLQSRWPNYRWRDTQFINGEAQVSPALAELARKDQFFNSDFWVKSEPPTEPAAPATSGDSANVSGAKSESNSTDPPKTEPPKTDPAGDDEGKGKGKGKGNK